MAMLAVNGGEPVVRTGWVNWPIVGKTELELIRQVTESGNWSYNGPMETRLRQLWSDFMGVKYTIPAANGTVTLQLAWESLDIGYGDEVIVPGLTWQATAASVLDVNAIPILVDVEEDSWCIDPKAVERAITNRTRAIAVVHLYGTICNMDAIMAIARKKGLAVVEDCSHQHGSIYRGSRVGAIGDIGSFSLQNSKVFTSGEGGLLTTNTLELAEKLDALRNCGRRPVLEERYGIDTGNYVSEGGFIQSGNYRLTEFQAAVLIGQLELLPEQIAKRDENAKYLNAALAGFTGILPMRREPGTDVQSYFNFAFRYVKQHYDGLGVDKFRKALSAELNFPFTSCYAPLNQCELYTPLTKRRHAISEDFRRKIDPKQFSLPMCEKAHHEESVCAHHKLLLGSKEDMDRVIESISKVIKHRSELM
jgi:dTDP-4-amino-4,6-dideoxygalactose transaminase